MAIEPFKIDIPEASLTDLKERLSRTRWPGEVSDSGWQYGTNLAYLKELCTYWENEFDWRKQEAYLNQWPHFKTDIDGYGVHFIHAKGKGPDPTPLVFTHGWPGTTRPETSPSKGSKCRLDSRASPRRSFRRRAHGWKGISTSRTGQTSARVATSPQWRSRSFSLRTFALSSAHSGSRETKKAPNPGVRRPLRKHICEGGADSS